MSWCKRKRKTCPKCGKPLYFDFFKESLRCSGLKCDYWDKKDGGAGE